MASLGFVCRELLIIFVGKSRYLSTIPARGLGQGTKGLLKNKLRKLLGLDAVVPLAVKLIAFNLDRCQICIRDSEALGVLGIVDFRSNC